MASRSSLFRRPGCTSRRISAEAPSSPSNKAKQAKEDELTVGPSEPHNHGHRKRLRGRFRQAGTEAVSDYELLELVLFRVIPQRDIKPLAKNLPNTEGLRLI